MSEQNVLVSRKWLLDLQMEVARVRDRTFPPRNEEELLFHNMIGIQAHLSDVMDMIDSLLEEEG